MKTQTQSNTAFNFVRNTVAATVIILGATMAAGIYQNVQAEPLKANTIYVNTSTSLFEVDETTGTATLVGNANPSVSQIEDLAFNGNNLYGLSYLMQFFKYDTAASNMVSLNNYTSYSSHHQGFEYGNGVYYAASNYGLETVNLESGTFTYVGSYGLGAGEQVTDLAYSYDGKLYATVTFNISYGYDYLAVIDTSNGNMQLIGSTYIAGTRGLTEKNGELYAINSTGDLYSINKTTGAGMLLANAVVSGARGMATSSMDMGGDGTGGGALSLPVMVLMMLFGLVRLVRHGK